MSNVEKAVPLQFVVGKGGVGKSTVAAALAVAEAKQGKRVLAVELGTAGGLARVFNLSVDSGRDTTTPEEVLPGLHVGVIEGERALAEYLELVVPIKRVLNAVFSSKLYRYFVAAAPGLKELMTMGKVWFEHGKKKPNGEPEWDVIVVDAGASGHSLQYLQMPQAAKQTFRSGLVHRESVKVEQLIADPEKSAIHVVAIPEDMPLVEAKEIIQKLRDPLGLPVGELFVNRCRASIPPSTAVATTELSALSEQGEDGSAKQAVSTAVGDSEHGAEVLKGMAVAARRAITWHGIQERGIEQIEADTGLEVARLPLIVTEEFALQELETLANAITERDTGGAA